MIYPPLFKKSTHGKINKWTVEVEENKFRTISGYSDGVQTTSEWTICEGKNIGKKNETTPEQQAKAEADALYRKRKEVGYFEDINKSDVQVFFQPMLAKDWNDKKSKVKFPLASQKKIDGVRSLIKSDGMWSRNGKMIISAPHIFESLKPLFEKYPDLILDGELFAPKESCDFNKIISCVRKTKPTIDDLIESKKYIQYWVYDLPSDNGTFISRYKKLLSLDLPDTCVIVPVDQVDNMNDVDAYHNDYVSEGFEGQMLRVLDSPYENKRSKFLLKNKSFCDAEFEIKGVKEGIGGLSNKVGTLQFEINGKQFYSAVNGTHEYLEELWLNKDNLIGQTATIKYFELTSDGIPRFPKVIQIGREQWE